MPTALVMQNSQAVALVANVPKIIGMQGRFSIQVPPGLSITVEGSLNSSAVQAEFAGGSRQPDTWVDIVGGPIAGPALDFIEADLTALSLTAATTGTVYLFFRN